MRVLYSRLDASAKSPIPLYCHLGFECFDSVPVAREKKEAAQAELATAEVNAVT